MGNSRVTWMNAVPSVESMERIDLAASSPRRHPVARTLVLILAGAAVWLRRHWRERTG